VLAWTVRFRIPELIGTPSRELAHALRFAPVVATLVAVSDSHLFPLLSVLNAAGYAFLFARNRGERLAGYLCICSFVTACAAAPEEFGRLALPEFDRGVWVLYCIGAALICLAAVWRDPRSGLAGGVLTLAAVRLIFHRWDPSWNTAVQMGLLFVLMHSLRWLDDRHAGARLVRIVLTSAWVAHAFYWMNSEPRLAGFILYSAAAAPIVVCGAQRLIAGTWGSRMIPAAAVLVWLSWPYRFVFAGFQTLSFGFVAVMLGFLLFVAGTIAALTKHRWNKAARLVE
jgi:hypothetical protein